MRVIAGTARSLPLKTIEGLDTRPTTDRIKETLFNMLMPDVPNSKFLDLFSGSGAIGIEALSRGAKECVFVENNPAAIKCINSNLKFTKLDDKASVMRYDAVGYIAGLKNIDFDVIFMDPPYHNELEKNVMTVLSEKTFVADTLIVIEAALEEDFSYLQDLGFTIIKEKKYKTNKHVFVEKD